MKAGGEGEGGRGEGEKNMVVPCSCSIALASPLLHWFSSRLHEAFWMRVGRLLEAGPGHSPGQQVWSGAVLGGGTTTAPATSATRPCTLQPHHASDLAVALLVCGWDHISFAKQHGWLQPFVTRSKRETLCSTARDP